MPLSSWQSLVQWQGRIIHPWPGAGHHRLGALLWQCSSCLSHIREQMWAFTLTRCTTLFPGNSSMRCNHPSGSGACWLISARMVNLPSLLLICLDEKYTGQVDLEWHSSDNSSHLSSLHRNECKSERRRHCTMGHVWFMKCSYMTNPTVRMIRSW